tara:strand:+ start:15647 stop:16261 length:615 start_codon:yes stop_codon:yes gene_type:complete
MGKPGKTKMVKLGPQQKYGMHQESAKTQRADDLKYMPVDDRAGTKQMKTGLYQDRMDGKLPQNPMLMQYGMSEKAVKQVGKHIAMPQVTEEGKPLKPASSVGSPSEAARKSKADALSEGYKTESIKTKGNVRSTVMALDVPKPKTSVVEEAEPSKQYAGTYVKRKFLPGYKSVSSDSAKEAYKAQKRKGRLTKYESVDKKADRG